MSARLKWLATALIGGAVLVAAVVSLNLRGEGALDAEIAATAAPAPGWRADPDVIARGAYLARAGNCQACHTARGGEPYAGGRAIETPFGTVFSSNLTPDADHGLGRWSAPQFWRALHHGRSADGRLLTPAFPYDNTTLINRADSDALYAYLRSVPPVAQAVRAHELRFPFNTQAALAVWRALYFEPREFLNDTTQSAEWNRGAYLVQGLGHCNACHASRNALGATSGPLDLGGGLIPVHNWYAPSLADPREAGVADWSRAEIVALLQTGVANRPSGLVTASGPMGEVVLRSTQHLSDGDLGAMAAYLQTLGAHTDASPLAAAPSRKAANPRGEKLYADHCANCHGDSGKGVAGAYPRLAGNRAVTMAVPANLVRMVVEGGFAPATPGHQRPFGMPPFGQTLGNDDIAGLLTHVRQSWGNQADAVSALEVNRYRGSAQR
ncbi:MAG: alcohol dehydrogenase [Burkholderiales bacterium 28-67-8]|nr:MAG: alcohol dehydrogenase [Burkholderiales bacterium 28-67-8]